MSVRKTIFGQAVIGPPGSGKSTYCHAMADFLRSQNRKVALVNLDPGNDLLPFTSSIDVSKLITVQDVMENYNLGPNGALVYCMEFLEKNLDWLFVEIEKFKDHYFIFDLPGQVELYTHNNSVKNIMKQLEAFGFRLCCVQLIDSHYCSDPGKFISVLLTAMTSMFQMEMPQVNVLSKVDLAEQHGRLHFGLDFYTEVLDLNYLLEAINADPFMKKYRQLNAALIDVVENYSFVSFLPLSISDSQLLKNVRAAVDKANGYVFGAGEENERNIVALLSTAVGAQFHGEFSGTISEKFLSSNNCDEDEASDNENSMSVDESKPLSEFK
ncbi:GPN-loop GTPase 2-like isoform X1 [Daphnia pulex]|uniref:GPN-loop GTPase 2-like isoform X1 n=1 Tax=Daphnia pulex TaxID=6669 RepID=UPI001EDD3AFB|nr:GPN-loop GTPase 2-like isoform X1 [Daphnia pulex]